MTVCLHFLHVQLTTLENAHGGDMPPGFVMLPWHTTYCILYRIVTIKLTVHVHATVSLVDPDVRFSVPKLFRLHKYGVSLIKALSRDRYRFHVTSGVQLLKKDRERVSALAPKDYVELIFKAWERSKWPTYPPTWEGLFTVLKKMDLGHLVEPIAKCVTGSVPEIEDSPQTSELEGPVGEKEKGWLYMLIKWIIGCRFC